MSNLKELIKASGHSQAQVAAAIKMSGSQLSVLVNDNKALMQVPYYRIIDLCNALRCTPYDITPMHYDDSYRRELPSILAMEADKLSVIFTLPEQQYMADMLNGHIYTVGCPVASLRHLVMDADHYDNLGEKWSVTLTDLVDKVDSLSPMQGWAVIVLIRQWWDNESRDINKIF
jgi:DNA-binding Xre family transcriptional regulator